MMNRPLRLFILSALSFAVLSSGCNKNPFDRTKSSSGNGALGTFGAAGSMKIFQDELKSGGGAFEYPSGDNQTLAFNDRSNPISERSIRYSWNGQPVSNPQHSGGQTDPEFVFVGFDLMHTPTLASYNATPGRNISAAGYRRVTFEARGSLSTFTILKIEVSEPSSPAPTCIDLSPDGSLDSGSGCSHASLSSNWTGYSIAITAGEQTAVKDFFKATFVYNNPNYPPVPPLGRQPGMGGVVYFDEILYQP